MSERKVNLSPEERTIELFGKDVTALADALVEDGGMIIAIPNSDRRIKLVEVGVFERVGPRYREIRNMQAGDLWTPPMRRINQSLVIAKDQHGVGSCVRLLKAKYFDPSNNSFVPELTLEGQEFKQGEGAIARYLGLGKKEKTRLKFLDTSDTLYVIKEGQEEQSTIEPDTANKELENLAN